MFLAPNCYKRSCVHFLGVADPNAPDDDDRQRPRCRAFPDGIPEEIAYGDNEHLEPVEGDHGITFRAGVMLFTEDEVENEDEGTKKG
jgi:hypothetical protein